MRHGGQLLDQYAGVRSPRPSAGRLDRAAVNRVAAYVEAELDTQLTLDRLAAAVNLSPYHFARGFKASTGMMPHQFVTARRLDRARSLLLGTSLNVTAIAHSLGLSNVRHFRQLFRAYFGVLPGDLRDRRQQESTLSAVGSDAIVAE
jgi:AraC family transcriptional regulator